MPESCPQCGSQNLAFEPWSKHERRCRDCGRSFSIERPIWARWDTLWELAIVVVVLGFVLALFLLRTGPTIASYRQVCINNLQNIGRALQQYRDLHGSFPPAYIADAQGRPMHSWRVLILPQLEREDLYQRYDFTQPWNSAHNLELADEMPLLYACPMNQRKNRTNTEYVAAVGPRFAFASSGAPQPPAKNLNARADTIMLMEWVGSGICWLEPRDGPPRANGAPVLPPMPTHETVTVLCIDGHTDSLPATTTPAQFQTLLTIAGEKGAR